MWIKYWTLWAWGTTEKNPAYMEVSSLKEFKQNVIPNIEEKHNYSDKFRGIGYKKIKHPPIDWIKKHIKYAFSAARSQRDKARKYKALLQEITEK